MYGRCRPAVMYREIRPSGIEEQEADSIRVKKLESPRTQNKRHQLIVRFGDPHVLEAVGSMKERRIIDATVSGSLRRTGADLKRSRAQSERKEKEKDGVRIESFETLSF